MNVKWLPAGEQCSQSLTFLVAKGVDDFDWLHLEGRATVLTEHGADGVQHYLPLGQICSGDLYEDILGVQADLHQMGTPINSIQTQQAREWQEQGKKPLAEPSTDHGMPCSMQDAELLCRHHGLVADACHRCARAGATQGG